MNIKAVIAGILALAVSIVVVVLVLGKGPSEAAKYNMVRFEQPKSENPLPISKSGPQPKVVVSELEYEFGHMQLGEERSHDFVIKNAGEAPLTLQMGETTCQCAYGDLQKGEVRTIQPGDSLSVKLTWKPERHDDHFSKGADIWTNDPDKIRQKISLRAVGRVAARFNILPQKEWPCPDVIDNKPAICTGVLGSGVLSEFKITSVESRGTPLEYELEPLAGEDLKANLVIFGYHVRITIKPEMQLGTFAIPVTIKTNIPEDKENSPSEKMSEFDVLVMGVRRGPIRMVGSDWIDEKMAAHLGSFEATMGKEVQIPMFIRNLPEEGLKFTKPPEVTPPELKVELVREEKSGGRTRYALKVA
ncbi:MAG: DUF1573 domain-containing protein, partial [Planctomycetia bacterium]|nr:DUF1573 domain-containing protein [Planctomycetia bacterium]